MREITEIIIHASATRPEWMAGNHIAAQIEEIRRWHKGRGWRDIGYHYIISRDGIVGEGRPVEQTGTHVRGHNTGTIGICLIGGHGSARDDHPLEHFTLKQMRALWDLVADLRKQYPAIERVTGHNQYANKACPGFYVPDHYSEAQTPVLPDVEPTPAKPKPNILAALIAAVTAFLKRFTK